MKLRFRDKKQEIGDIWSYFFEPVEPVEWRAGQSIRLELPRKTFGVSERRFTIASAPQENHIQITTRKSGSRFKLLLDELTAGDTISAYGIEGSFIWQDTPQQKIFVAGGIGVTPYRAMLISGVDVTDITLVYGTSEARGVFETELVKSAVKTQFIRGQRLTSADIIGLEGWQKALIYLSGPEAMVQSLYGQLIQAGKSKKDIKADLFTGNL